MSWFYDEAWVVENERLIRQTAPTLGADRASVWNARMVSDAASGQLTRQASRWRHLNELRAEVGQTPLPVPVWVGEEQGPLRVEGLTILNDPLRPGMGSVPWMVQGYRMFDAFGLHLYGIQSFGESLDYPLALGFNTIFISTMLAAQNGHPVTLDPRVNRNLYDVLSDVAALAQSRGVRLWVYACADANALGISAVDQQTHWLGMCERLAGGYHIPSVANEGPNGNSADVQGFPTPSNCPVWSRGSGGERPPRPNGATLCEYEVKRRSAGEEPFKMTADCASTEYLTLDPGGPQLGVPVVQVENTLAAEVTQLGRRSNEPRLFVAQATAAMMTRPYGSGGYACGSDDSRLGRVPGPNQDRCTRAAIVAMRNGFLA
jgi:hypothetical protein